MGYGARLALRGLSGSWEDLRQVAREYPEDVRCILALHCHSELMRSVRAPGLTSPEELERAMLKAVVYSTTDGIDTKTFFEQLGGEGKWSWPAIRRQVPPFPR